MSVPGGNLLLEALDLIASQPVRYEQFTGQTTTAAGYNIAAYAAPVTVSVGSVQPLPKNRYQEMGLDLQKEYVTWFVPKFVIGTERDSKGDVITYAGRRWQLESDVDWFTQDGWMAIIGVDIGAAS